MANLLAPRANRMVASAVNAALLGGMLSVAGCDSAQNASDRDLRDRMSATYEARAKGDSAGAVKDLEGAATSGSASAASKAQAAALLGQLQLDAGRETLRLVDKAELDAARLALEIAQLAAQVSTSSTFAQSYGAYEPSKLKEQIEQRINDARGGPDKKLWIDQEGVKLPTLAAVSANITELEAQIATINDKLAAIDTQRQGALNEAEQAHRDADGLSRQSAVDAYARASDARKRASDFGTQIEVAKSELEPKLRELAIAQSLQTTLSGVIASLQQQSKMLDEGWGQISGQVSQQKQVAQSIVTGGNSGEAKSMTLDLGIKDYSRTALPAASINEKAKFVAETVRKADELRQSALENLGGAAKQFQSAARDATTLGQQLTEQANVPNVSGTPLADTIDLHRDVMTPEQFKLQEANAQQLLGALHASRAASLGARIALQQTLEQSLRGVAPIPPELADANLPTEQDKAMREAEESFKLADELLEGIINSRPAGKNSPTAQGVQRSARVAQLFTIYSSARLAAEHGSSEQVETLKGRAQSVVQQALEAGVSMPPLPSGFLDATPPSTMAAAPGSTTAPSDGAAPENATTEPSTQPSADTEAPAANPDNK